MKTHEFKDAMYFRAACDCDTKGCDLELCFEASEDFGDISLTIKGDFAFDQAHSIGLGWFYRKWRWIKAIIRLIFTGRVEVMTDFVFNGNKHVDSFIGTLGRAQAQINAKRKILKAKNEA